MFVMRRREFITLLGGVAIASSAAASAEQSALPIIGFLNMGEPKEREWAVAAFLQGLRETGFVEGQNVVVEYRWARGQYSELPALAADLVRYQVAVITTGGGPGPALAAKAATKTIPIIFNHGGNPVEQGLVASLNHPGGNATGFVNLHTELEPKRLELLHQILPNVAEIGVLVNPDFPDAQTELRLVQQAAAALGLQLYVANANTEGEIDTAFANFANQRLGAIFIEGGALFLSRRRQLVALASRYALPASYFFPEFGEVGGLVSYGPSVAETYRLTGTYVGRVLKGEKPSDLPVQQATKIELLINLRTAKALGLDVPASIIVQADKVIE
jgi:putative tryptophan/tyrosine transport system substrate-binding protein